MIKDKSWLLEKHRECIQSPKTGEKMLDEGYELALNDMLIYINQLDEPETLSQEWIDEHKYFAEEKIGEDAVVKARDLRNLLVPKQDKPVIPQYVADFIENWRHEGLTIQEWFTFNYDDDNDDKVSKYLYDNDDETNIQREFVLIDAIRYGYEVEKEKKYYIYSIKGYLGYNTDKTRLSWYASSFPNDVFTEQEIKAIDERYWAFAVEVTQ